MANLLLMLAGVVCAGLGGELFVRGTVGMARAARVSPGIIGATVAAFATSSPELTVAVNSALAQASAISLGDALGSNVVNIALVLALAIVMSGQLRVAQKEVRREFTVAVIAPPVTAVLALDGVISRRDSVALLAIFAAWLIAVIREVRRQRSMAGAVLGEPHPMAAIAYTLVGIALLIAAGRLIVVAAKGIAAASGWDEFMIGATIVALGTSVPELATCIIAWLRGHDEISIGTILGSNIFNGLFIVPVAAGIFPIVVIRGELAVALAFGLIVVALVFPTRQGFVRGWRGLVLLGLYVAFLTAVTTVPAG